MCLLLSSHLVLGLHCLLFPFIPQPSHHSPFQFYLTTCTKHLKAACVTLDSSVHSGLIFLSTHSLFFLSIHGTLITRLQHHISKASIVFLPVFLIVIMQVLHTTVLLGSRNTYFTACMGKDRRQEF